VDDDSRPSLLDVVCFVPLGLAQLAGEELPKLARQRRQAVENRIQLARWIGQIAVQQADREIRKRWSAAHERPSAAPPIGSAGSVRSVDEVSSIAAPPAVDEVVPVADGVAAPAVVPAADELPISGYESLAAQQVVHRLSTLTVDEREAIRRFEAAHRQRRTILAKLDQLQAG